MKKIHIVNHEINVLGEAEQVRFFNHVQERAEDVADRLQFIYKEIEGRKIGLGEAYKKSQSFEAACQMMDVETRFNNLNIIIEANNSAMQIEPNYYDFDFVNAKNLIASLESLEDRVVRERMYNDNKDTISFINAGHELAGRYLEQAIEKINREYTRKDAPVIKAIKTEVNGRQCSLLRTRGQFTIMSTKNINEDKEAHVRGAIFMMQAKTDYEQLLEKGIFKDEETAMVIIGNYALTHTISGRPEEYDKGITYLTTIQDRHPNKETIVEQINYLNQLKSAR